MGKKDIDYIAENILGWVKFLDNYWYNKEFGVQKRQVSLRNFNPFTKIEHAFLVRNHMAKKNVRIILYPYYIVNEGENVEEVCFWRYTKKDSFFGEENLTSLATVYCLTNEVPFYITSYSVLWYKFLILNEDITPPSGVFRSNKASKIMI
jgi:hypothetical protein